MGSINQGLNRNKEFAMGDLTAEMSPQHFNRVEPGAIGRQIEQDQPTRSIPENRFNFVVFMGVGVIQDNIDRAGGMTFQHCLEQLSYFSPPLVATDKDNGLTCVIIDRPKTIAFGGVARCEDHDL